MIKRVTVCGAKDNFITLKPAPSTWETVSHVLVLDQDSVSTDFTQLLDGF